MTSRSKPRGDLLGVLIGTERGLYQLLPGEPLQRILPDMEITSLDVRDEVALAAVPGRGVWQHDGGPATAWRQVWEGDPRCVRIDSRGIRHIGAAPAALLRAAPGEEEWTASPSLDSVVRYQRTRSRGGSGSSWELSAIAFPGSALLVAVGGAGAWLSNDEGRSWMPRSEGIDPNVTGLQEHPERSDRVYATTGGGLFRSEDGGFSWLQSISGLDRSVAHSAAVLPGAPDAMVLSASRRAGGSGGALFRSIDGGVRWIRLILGDEDEWAEAPLVASLPGSRDTVFAFADGVIWASHDRGGDWRPLTDPPARPLPRARCLAVAL